MSCKIKFLEINFPRKTWVEFIFTNIKLEDKDQFSFRHSNCDLFSLDILKTNKVLLFTFLT